MKINKIVQTLYITFADLTVDGDNVRQCNYN